MSYNKSKKKIGVFPIVMITVAYASSPSVFPTIAEYGYGVIGLFLITLVLFLLPMIMTSSELASTWPSRGGVYTWVKEALPGPFGFVAIWLQFLDIIISSPACLTFIAATFAYAVDPKLAEDKYYLMGFILISFWMITFISFFSMKASGWINTFGNIFSLFLPMGILIVLVGFWYFSGNSTHITSGGDSIFPHINSMGSLVFYAAILYSFTGLETSASHTPEMINPKKNFAKAMFYAGIILFVLGFSSLAIAVIVPSGSINLASGMMQTFTIGFNRFGLGWLIPIVAVLMSFGTLISLNATVIGPSKGLYGASVDGELPPILTKENKHGMPVNIFIFQAIVVSLLCLVFILMPNVNACYWIIAAIGSASYLCMYVMMFAAVIILRYKKPQVKRGYKIPGGKLGVWIIAGTGLLTSLFGIAIAFYPPDQIDVGKIWVYELVLIGGVLILAGLGFVIYIFRKPEWANVKVKDHSICENTNENIILSSNVKSRFIKKLSSII